MQTRIPALKEYMDDDLTKQEEDIICGVYRVLSDDNSLGEQVFASQACIMSTLV